MPDLMSVMPNAVGSSPMFNQSPHAKFGSANNNSDAPTFWKQKILGRNKHCWFLHENNSNDAPKFWKPNTLARKIILEG